MNNYIVAEADSQMVFDLSYGFGMVLTGMAPIAVWRVDEFDIISASSFRTNTTVKVPMLIRLQMPLLNIYVSQSIHSW
jgi:hypothetical protein